MSNKRTFSKFSQPEEQKKFCSVCHKAGKTEREYTSHFIKSTPGPNGIVICPTILSSECKFCLQRGHWASEEHCPALREKKKREKKEQYNTSKRQSHSVVVSSTATKRVHLQKLSAYDALSYDSDNETAPAPSKKEEFPALGNASVKVTKLPTAGSYADMAKKEVKIIVREEEPTLNYEVLTARGVQEERQKSNLFATAVTSGRAGNFEFLGDYDGEEYDGEEYDGEEYDGEEYEHEMQWRVPNMKLSHIDDDNW